MRQNISIISLSLIASIFCGLVACKHNGDFNLATSQIKEESKIVIIQAGMTQRDIESVLGEPTVVLKNREELETWEYYKVASRIDPGLATSGSGEKKQSLIIHNFQVSDMQQVIDSNLPTEKPLSISISFNGDQTVNKLSFFTSKH
jgi:hypothetical protein